MEEFITKESLLAHGIEVDEDDIDTLLAELNEELEERVGSEITESLTKEQLEILVAMQDKASDEEIGQWLSKNVPDFEQIVQEEIDTILDELADTNEEAEKAA